LQLGSAVCPSSSLGLGSRCSFKAVAWSRCRRSRRRRHRSGVTASLARAASGSLQSSPLLLMVHGGAACCGHLGISTTSATWEKVAAWLSQVSNIWCAWPWSRIEGRNWEMGSTARLDPARNVHGTKAGFRNRRWAVTTSSRVSVKTSSS
jgi:hypothetical protein